MYRKTLLISLAIITLYGCVNNTPGTDCGTIKLDVYLENISKLITYNLSAEDVKNIRIDFTDGPVVEDSIVFENNEDICFSLIAGSWRIEIYGLDEVGKELVFSYIDLTVSASLTNKRTIILKPLMNDTSENDASGSVNIVFDWSKVDSCFQDEVFSVSADFGLTENTAEDISHNLNIDLSGGTASYSKTPCPSGDYIIEFKLFNNENKLIAVVADSVNIRDNLVSQGTLLLEDTDFQLSGIDVIIYIDLPEVEDITFNYSNGEVFSSEEVSAGITISVTNNTVFDSYEWSLYGYSLPSEIKDVTLPADIGDGIHHLTVYTARDSDLLSGTLRFIVED